MLEWPDFARLLPFSSEKVGCRYETGWWNYRERHAPSEKLKRDGSSPNCDHWSHALLTVHSSCQAKPADNRQEMNSLFSARIFLTKGQRRNGNVGSDKMSRSQRYGRW